MKRPLNRFLAAVLGASLVFAAPGLEPYRILAETVAVQVQGTGGVPGSAAAAGSAFQLGQGAVGLRHSSGVSLDSVFQTWEAPEETRSVSISEIARPAAPAADIPQGPRERSDTLRVAAFGAGVLAAVSAETGAEPEAEGVSRTPVARLRSFAASLKGLFKFASLQDFQASSNRVYLNSAETMGSGQVLGAPWEDHVGRPFKRPKAPLSRPAPEQEAKPASPAPSPREGEPGSYGTASFPAPAVPLADAGLRPTGRTERPEEVVAASGRNPRPLESPIGSAVPHHGDHEPPTGGQVQEKEKGGALGFGRNVWLFISNLMVHQVGAEALGAAMPLLMQKNFGDFTAVAQLAIFSSITGMIGRLLGSSITARFGLKKTYMATNILRLISISTLAGLLGAGILSAVNPWALPLMYVFYSINGFLGGVEVTAESTIPATLIGHGQGTLEKFWTVQHFLAEVVGVAGPIATGITIAHFGFLPALIAFPVTFGISIAIFAFVKLPKLAQVIRMRVEPSASGGRPPQALTTAPRPPVSALFGSFFRRITNGARLVWKTPILRVSLIAYALYMMVNPFLYSMLAPAYALRVAGDPELAASIAGWITGLYSLGGLIAAAILFFQNRKIGRGREAGTIDDTKEAEILRRSMLRWMGLGAVGLAALATFAFPLPTLGQWIALPAALGWLSNLTLPAAAFILFGIPQVISTLKQRSLFQSRIPEKDAADANGFFNAVTLAVTTTGLIGLKYLFKGFEGFTPFVYLSFGIIPLAAVYLLVTWWASKVTRDLPKPAGQA